MNIEVMNVDDYDEVMALWKSDEGIGLAIGDEREGIARYLQRNPATSFVARLDGQIIGTILCEHDGRRAYIYHFFVQTEHRGKGVGKQLLQHSLQALGEQGIPRCLLTVLKENQTGNQFWQAQKWLELDFINTYSYTLIENNNGHIEPAATQRLSLSPAQISRCIMEA
ncbi:MAG TPA: GNAT family N-acetyltransferase [Abditibacteriaceae bacterium]|jgi:ribosomal protein S18 acetylase RimI-like enzyme